ncbi:hypothetical protein J2X32_001492 [Rheinheimera pacifica]|uniref:ATPase n=1 Tax=Rheinheimera pacifica TaxID=173990 RepID=UPI000CBB2E40|nr:ATPase [Rheinheimera pacifica]MDR6982874.1 hypothetical protein [Rheinheimera pacifica]PKM20099.1 MAG: ATPase [Gammaproteobacteria bacterium HGW-Gammaproteobacteria-15]
MKVESLRSLLDWTSGYHRHLSNCLADCARHQLDDRCQMLLNYLADKEMKLAIAVQGFKDVGEDKALNTWCTEHLDRHPLLAGAACDDAFISMTTTEIITEIENQHQQILLLYQNLYDRSQTPKIQELLAQVRDLEKNEAQQMMHGANRLEDL